MNGFGFRISAAIGVSVVLGLGALGGAAAVSASSATSSPREEAQAEKDQTRSEEKAKSADAEETKARDDAALAEKELKAARDDAAASVQEQQKASQELRAAAAESDPARKAQLQTAAGQDVAAASSGESKATRELSQGEVDAKRALQEEKAADRDRKAADELAARAEKEQRQAQGQAGKDHKIWICHATHSASNPYVGIEVDLSGLNGHGDHPGDIIPAPAGGCPAGKEKATAANLEDQAAVEKSKARQDKTNEKNSHASAQTESAAAAASAAEAAHEQQAAAAESDPTKAAELQAEAEADGQLAALERLQSEIDKALAADEKTKAVADEALAQAESAAAKMATEETLKEAVLSQKKAALDQKILICHATGLTNPAYTLVAVPKIGLGGNGSHPGDIIPVPAKGCPLTSAASAVAQAEADDARTQLPLPNGPIQAEMAANTLSVAPQATVLVVVTAENLRTSAADNLELGVVLPPGFSIVSAPNTHLVDGNPSLTLGRLAPESAAEFVLELRLNSRTGRPRRVRLSLLLKVGATARRAQLTLTVSPGVTPTGAAPVTG